jgi:hypothetical protein
LEKHELRKTVLMRLTGQVVTRRERAASMTTDIPMILDLMKGEHGWNACFMLNDWANRGIEVCMAGASRLMAHQTDFDWQRSNMTTRCD